MTPMTAPHGGDRPASDEELRGLIARSLDDSPEFWTGLGYPAAVILIDVQHGIVMLTGLVRSPAQRAKVDALVRRFGALGVDNRLRVEREVRDKAS